MSPVELRRNRVSAQTQWWTAGSPSVSWTLQNNNMFGSSSSCSHCRRSSQSLFTRTQHWPPTKLRTCKDWSSHTPDNTESVGQTWCHRRISRSSGATHLVSVLWWGPAFGLLDTCSHRAEKHQRNVLLPPPTSGARPAIQQLTDGSCWPSDCGPAPPPMRS